MDLNEIRNSLSQITSAAKKSFLNDDEERRREIFNEVERRERDLDPDQHGMGDRMFGQHKVQTTVQDMMGTSDPSHREAREARGFGVGDTWQERVGTTAGRVGADVVRDDTRNIWWFVNAIQAVQNLISEEVINRANPDIRKTSPVWDENGNPMMVTDNFNQTTKMGVTNAKGETMPGYRVKTVGEGKNAKKYYRQLNTRAIFPQLMTLPGSLVVNQSLGLLNPFGGQEGYQAVDPSEDDPTKTANIISEVGQKYILGRTGNLLPWNEFKKVRPDVSKDEYMRYKAFKYDKGLDLNPFDDGNITLPGGVIKYTNDGIHGAELQYLGRSAPMTTAVLPLAITMAGLAAGTASAGKLPEEKVRTQADLDSFRRKQWRRGLGGGVAAALGGIAVGNLVENERRNRKESQLTQSMPIANPEMSNL